MNSYGAREITPNERLYLLTPDEWEGFIEDCARQLKAENEYVHVQLLGGAGDKGRDVCGYGSHSHTAGSWDLYQGKHYDSTLSPSEFLPDLAKFIYCVKNGDYTLPRNYYICALKVGTKLFDLVSQPESMKEYVLEEWKKKKGDFGKYKQPFTHDIEVFINSFPFDVFKVKTPKDLLEIHSRNHSKHWSMFKVLAERGENPSVPDAPDVIEAKYITELLKVYGECVGDDELTLESLETKKMWHKHFKNQRVLFYCAEGLNRFSRDKLPGAFDDLLSIVQTSVDRKLNRPYENAFKRMDEVLDKASNTQIQSNLLKHRLDSTDLEGCCHHLVNLNKIGWMDEE
ncbi:ABC-three component system protein [Vibrio cyclitrophicus]|uniref:ABC-three component system protein n=1 Tax=Vibrio cyclitrophicus TaxID=47951 RepID=UPI000C840B49|nr:ABC-three component system protein [Vibrio cyclitrophicus]PMF20395.1 hypothetical protein BCV18_05665 [Vibrio cyclitrophicus]